MCYKMCLSLMSELVKKKYFTALPKISQSFSFVFLYDMHIMHYAYLIHIFQNSQKRIMGFKLVLFTTFLVLLFWPSKSMHTSTTFKRLRRAPPEQRENLIHCTSAFTNFPKFKLRGCPPPKFCSLSRPLKKRYCVKENSPKFAFPK